MNYRSAIATARGLGSAKTGVSHWWMQRVTAVLLVPLSFFLLNFIDLSLNSSYQETIQWLASPLNSVSITVWTLAVFYHAALGLQIIIEDYVAGEGKKIILVWAVNLTFLFFGLTALIALFRIILAG
jgi:succinate dehydrogenase / fumarate reductase, membrane anchor subunit